jgi:hypothetical protein
MAVLTAPLFQEGRICVSTIVYHLELGITAKPSK